MNSEANIRYINRLKKCIREGDCETTYDPARNSQILNDMGTAFGDIDLNSKISDISTNLDDLSGNVGAYSQEVTSVDGKTTDRRNTLEQLKGKIKELKGDTNSELNRSLAWGFLTLGVIASCVYLIQKNVD